MRISENIPGKENSTSKGPEAGVSLVCVMNLEVTRVMGRRDEGGEQQEMRRER